MTDLQDKMFRYISLLIDVDSGLSGVQQKITPRLHTMNHLSLIVFAQIQIIRGQTCLFVYSFSSIVNYFYLE
jgi:hypothetical protein